MKKEKKEDKEKKKDKMDKDNMRMVVRMIEKNN
jgi:hypothetical protein